MLWRKSLKPFLFVVLAILIFYFILCLYIAFVAVGKKKKRTRQSLEKVLSNPSLSSEHEHARRYIERIETLENAVSKTLTVESFDGLKLKAYYAPCGKSTDTFVLLVHGYDSDAFTAFGSQIKFYKDLGYDVIVIDQRACGNSEGKYVTFAVNESRDVADWCHYITSEFKNCKNIVLHGISLGGASVLLSLDKQLPSEAKCIIDDCGFDSPEGILHHVLKKDYHLPSFIRKTAIIFCEILCKCRFRGVNTEDVLKNADLPVLFIHGALDTYVPYYMSEDNYKAAKNPFEFYTVADAHHANSFILDESGCFSAVKRLLEQVLQN